MDSLIIRASDAKEFARFKGTTEEFKRSRDVVEWCIQKKQIVRLSPQDMNREERERYTDYLVSLMQSFLKENPGITSWSDFASKPENNKTAALFHQFGVRGAIFGVESFQTDHAPAIERSRTNLTFEEFFEMCQIEFHYQGTLGSFKKMISRRYGSFAEYCINKGYDINGTKWENDETAVRVARKLGTVAEVKKRASSLYKYLTDKGLLDMAFRKEHL